MKGNSLLSLSLILTLAAGQLVTSADSLVQKDPRVKLSPKVPIKAYGFSLKDVRLLDGPFRDAMLRDQKFLLGVDPDRLLHMFRVTGGLPSSATPWWLGGLAFGR